MDTRLRVRCAERCPQLPAGAAQERSLFRVARLRTSSSPAVRLAGGLVTTAPAPRVQSTESSSFPGVMPPALL